jgi:hypothetical protein
MMRLLEQRRLHPLYFYVMGAVAMGTLAYNVLNSNNDDFEHHGTNKDTIVAHDDSYMIVSDVRTVLQNQLRRLHYIFGVHSHPKVQESNLLSAHSAYQ